MRFHAVHKLMSYLLAASAVGTLTASGAVPVATLILLGAAGVFSWFIEPGTRLGGLLDRAGLVFNVGALAFFALSLYQVVRSFPEPDMTPILNLVMFLLAYKLMHRRSNRDYLQLYVLSFLLVLAGAWLGQSVLFVVGFGAYVILATWTLILFHLRREIEDNYLVKHSPEAGTEKVTAARVLNSRRVVGRAFFVTTGVVAVAVFLGAAFVFAAVPRIGMGFILGGVRRKVNLVGFSDEVMLGHHGVLSTENQTVVLRAEVPNIAALPQAADRERAVSMLYWRGTVYDTYRVIPPASGSGPPFATWVRSKREAVSTRVESAGLTPRGNELRVVTGPELPESLQTNPTLRRRAALADTFEQRIWVVGLQNPVAIALDQPAAFELPPPGPGTLLRTQVEPRWGGEVALKLSVTTSQGLTFPSDAKGAHYIAHSRDIISRPRLQAGRPVEALPPEVLEPYLTVPLSTSERVTALARSLTKDHPTTAGKVQAITEWLRQTHTYTTNLRRNPQVADPLEDFLFHQTAGHCEYFASATAILLRLAGVPSRVVYGFLGGEWNDLSGHITVRDNRAHTWVEAYFGTFGWVRVDATPAAAAPSGMSKLKQLFDSLELVWSRWVVDYDVGRQVDLARRLSRRIGLERGALQGKVPWPLVLRGGGALAVVGLGVLMVRWTRRRRRAGTPAGARRGPRAQGAAIERLWHTTCDRLARRGWTRAPSETPREYAARALAAGLPGADALAALAHLYAAARYGGREIPTEEVDRLRPALEILAEAPGPPARATAGGPADQAA
jgi:transglutaminase-like putative cysteine protease